MDSEDHGPPDIGLIQCGLCQSTFTRQEHLRRHVRSHTTEKPYHCLQCEKSFSRLDVLHRHNQSHGSRPFNSQTRANSRACKECAACRVRCPRGNPCSRCFQRQVPCVYPSARKRKVLTDDTIHGYTSPKRKSASSSGRTSLRFEQDQQSMALAGPISTLNPSGPGPQIEALDATASSLAAENNREWLSLQNSGEFTEPSPGLVNGVIPEFDPHVLDNDLNEWLGNMASVNWLSPQDADNLFPEGQLESLLLPGISDSGFELVENADGARNQLFETVNNAPNVENTHTASISVSSLHSAGEQHPPGTKSSTSKLSNGTARRSAPRSPEGTYYIEGGVGRAPFKGRSSWKAGIYSNGGRKMVEPPGKDSVCSENINISPLPSVSTGKYQSFVRRLVNVSDILRLNMEIPTQDDVEDLVRLYFDGFHPTYPFLLQGPSLFSSDSDWILLLAVVATGSRYANSAKYRCLGKILVHIIDRELSNQISNPPADDCNGLWNPVPGPVDQRHLDLVALQSAVLNCLFLLHCGKQSAVQRALHHRYHIIEAFHSLNILAAAKAPLQGAGEPNQDNSLGSWIESESRIRTGWMIWVRLSCIRLIADISSIAYTFQLLDSIVHYEFHCAPLIQLGDTNARLPCRDDLWDLCLGSETVPGIKDQSG